jgi:hypothetical protein
VVANGPQGCKTCFSDVLLAYTRLGCQGQQRVATEPNSPLFAVPESTTGRQPIAEKISAASGVAPSMTEDIRPHAHLLKECLLWQGEGKAGTSPPSASLVFLLVLVYWLIHAIQPATRWSTSCHVGPPGPPTARSSQLPDSL